MQIADFLIEGIGLKATLLAFLSAIGISNAAWAADEDSFGALTAKQFSDLSIEAKAEVYASVIGQIFDLYNSTDSTRHKARCLIALHNAKSHNAKSASDESSKLADLVLEELAAASVVDGDVLAQDVIYGVTEHNCAEQK